MRDPWWIKVGDVLVYGFWEKLSSIYCKYGNFGGGVVSPLYLQNEMCKKGNKRSFLALFYRACVAFVTVLDELVVRRRRRSINQTKAFIQFEIQDEASKSIETSKL